MNTADQPLHVMVAVLEDAEGRILISQRPPGKAMAGRWEFPGGKREAGEYPEAALSRELHEELGIQVTSAQPLIRLVHHYPGLSVLLDVYEVTAWQGRTCPLEGQTLRWVSKDALMEADLLEADRPIVNAILLPDMLLVTPDPVAGDISGFLESLEAALARSVGMVQLRATNLEASAYVELAREALALCEQHDAELLLNSETEIFAAAGAHGLHFNRHRLLAARQRPVSEKVWFSASCHSLGEIRHAENIGADFVLLSPVAPTASHLETEPLGWDSFENIVAAANIPVYALGGMTSGDVTHARAAGGQGIAAIRSLWCSLSSGR